MGGKASLLSHTQNKVSSILTPATINVIIKLNDVLHKKIKQGGSYAHNINNSFYYPPNKKAEVNMLVYYQNQLWSLKIALRENLFIEIKEMDPTRLVIIEQDKKREVVQICELETATERRLS